MPDVIVVGGGISGIAAAYELARRGADVLVLERDHVGAEQSAGLARIFRVAHTDPRLAALALESHAGWRRWEEQLGAGRLLGDEGLVSAGPRALERQAPAIEAAGGRWRPVPAAELPALVPAAAPDHPWGDGLLDPLGGAIRVRRTLAALAAHLEVRRAEAVAVEDHGAAAVVRLASGELLRAGRVLIANGTEAPVLAATAGLAVPSTFTHHVRLTYARARGRPAGRVPHGRRGLRPPARHDGHVRAGPRRSGRPAPLPHHRRGRVRRGGPRAARRHGFRGTCPASTPRRSPRCAASRCGRHGSTTAATASRRCGRAA